MREPGLREPWLRETKLDTDPAIAAVLFALQQAREDLDRFTDGISDERIWRAPSIGFHLRHIAGSLDRLTTYLEGRALADDQLATLRDEKQPGATRAQLLEEADRAIARTGDVIRGVTDFDAARYVGRERIETTAIGLIIHMAEHTQRHVGEVIVLSRYHRGELA
ncbi:MAG: hypothetical protein JWO80_5616 [Bryobacterales bacterium]|nr:hypothetical protein [Bryobacterales bacterium]